MTDDWAKPHHHGPKINSLSDVGPNFLGELTDYFTQNPLPVPLHQVPSYGLQTQTTRVTISAAIATTTATLKILDYDTETWDFADLHSTSTNPSRITAKLDGKYLVGAWVEFASNATGYRLTQILKNGTPISTDSRPTINGDVADITIATLSDAVATDYFQIRVLQNSGGNLNVAASAFYAARQTT